MARVTRLSPASEQPGPYVYTLLPKHHASASGLNLLFSWQTSWSYISISGSNSRYSGSLFRHKVHVQRPKLHAFINGETIVRLVVVVVKALKIHARGCGLPVS